MPKPEFASRQELREDIAGLREQVERNRVEANERGEQLRVFYREVLREAVAPIVQRMDIANGRTTLVEARVGGVETWQRDRSRIEHVLIWLISLMAAGGGVGWVLGLWL